MRQRGATFSTTPQEFQHKAGWFPAEASFQTQTAQFYPSNQTTQLLIPQFTQPIAFTPYQPTYPQQVSYPQYPTYRTETYYQPEDPTQMMVFRQPIAAQHVAAPRPFTQTTPPARSQPQIVIQSPAAPQVTTIHQPRVEKQTINPQTLNFDMTTPPRFDNLKYPTPGCFSIIQRGNIPGVRISPL